MSFSPNLISNNILMRAFQENSPVSPMKLQKLLYFVASEYGKKTGEPLLNESFQAWRYGPVVRSVYDEFRSFGAAPIRAYAKDAEGMAFTVDEEAYPQLRAVIDQVWRQGRSRSAVDLSRITHLPHSAWSKAFLAGERYIEDSDVRNDETYHDSLKLGRA